MRGRAARGVSDDVQAEVREEGAVRHRREEEVPQDTLPDVQERTGRKLTFAG